MPLDDFASKQSVEELKTEINELKKQNNELLEALISIDNNIKDGHIKLRGGEDIPKMSEIKQEMNKYANYVNKKTKEMNAKLESYGNIEKAVTDEARRIVRPLCNKFMRSEDNKTAFELEKNRVALKSSILASVGLFIFGATVCIITILKFL